MLGDNLQNNLESYTFNTKSTSEYEKPAGKSDDYKWKILETCNQVISWLDKNQTVEKDKPSTEGAKEGATPSSQSCTRVLKA